MRIILSCLTLLMLSFSSDAATDDVFRLQRAYPEQIKSATAQTIRWRDGTMMSVADGNQHKTQQEKLNSPSLLDQLQTHYVAGIPANTIGFNPSDDSGRIRYEPFFKKIYGNSADAVQSKLTVIYWLPKFFDKKYPLLVTTVNNVDKKLTIISSELEKLVTAHPNYLPYLDKPGGTFDWRVIANTNRLSMHSFGMTIDINSSLSNYWQWDLKKQHIPVTENAPLTYHNNIPWEIIPIFEKQGFIWGGKWHHYDTMHFEYRPELLVASKS